MDLLLNDLSIHGQFEHSESFQDSLKRIMLMRRIADVFGRDVYVHQTDLNQPISSTSTVHDAIQEFLQDQKMAFLGWLRKRGPFWDVGMVHSPDDWFEHQGTLVTGSAMAEAASRVWSGADCRLVSLTPSDWEFTPIKVDWIGDFRHEVLVLNYWELSELESALRQAEPPLKSWSQLQEVVQRRFDRLAFTPDCFEDLKGRPFVASAADRICDRLAVLNQLMELQENSAQNTSDWRRLYDDHFKGGVHFSDSSDTEKHEFRKQLSFRLPGLSDQPVLCGFHGKVKNPPFRIHFTWPVPSGEQLYVVYVGWKITTR